MYLKIWLAVVIGLVSVGSNISWGYVNGVGREEWKRLTSEERRIYEKHGWGGLQLHRRGQTAVGSPRRELPLSLPKLMDDLKSADSRVRHAAAYRIRETGDTGKYAVPMLIQALRDTDSDVRWVASGTLGELKEHAAEALPALKRVSDDEHAQVRKSAVEARQKIETALKLRGTTSQSP